MSRTVVKRWLSILASLCLAALSTMPFSPAAAANEPTGPSLELIVSDAVHDEPQRTVAVALDPGDTRLSGLTAAISYDEAIIQVVTCSVSEAGACNDLGGTVKFTVFNLNVLKANEQLLTVDFVILDQTAPTGSFDLTVETAIGGSDFTAVELAVTGAEFEIAGALAHDETGPAESTPPGSLTGDIISADTGIGIFGIDVCAVNTATDRTTCGSTNGWGAWRIDGLGAGSYVVEIVDPSGEHAPASFSTTIEAGEITTGLDAALDAAVGSDGVDDGFTDKSGVVEPDIVLPSRIAPKTIVYGASISGTARALETNQRLEGVQVCATQPLVLHQSCASTANDGTYVLDGLSTGNYWITAVDPLGRFVDGTPQLVGVVGDTSGREGVTILLAGA